MVLARGQQGNNYFDNLSAMFYEYFVDFDLVFCVSDESGTNNDWESYNLGPKLNLTLTGLLRKVPILYRIRKKYSASSACA